LRETLVVSLNKTIPDWTVKFVPEAVDSVESLKYKLPPRTETVESWKLWIDESANNSNAGVANTFSIVSDESIQVVDVWSSKYALPRTSIVIPLKTIDTKSNTLKLPSFTVIFVPTLVIKVVLSFNSKSPPLIVSEFKVL